jgi:hypothetical protein
MDWLLRELPLDNPTGVASNGGIICVTGGAAQDRACNLFTSTDEGATWALRVLDTAPWQYSGGYMYGEGNFSSIAWNGSRFMAVGNSGSAWSADGINWTLNPLYASYSDADGDSKGAYYLTCVAAGADGVFRGLRSLGDGGIASWTSGDGQSLREATEFWQYDFIFGPLAGASGIYAAAYDRYTGENVFFSLPGGGSVAVPPELALLIPDPDALARYAQEWNLAVTVLPDGFYEYSTNVESAISHRYLPFAGEWEELTVTDGTDEVGFLLVICSGTTPYAVGRTQGGKGYLAVGKSSQKDWFWTGCVGCLES